MDRKKQGDHPGSGTIPFARRRQGQSVNKEEQQSPAPSLILQRDLRDKNTASGVSAQNAKKQKQQN